MKNSIVRTLAALTLAVMALAVGAGAQARVVNVNVPFAFNFGDQSFPAGSYSLIRPLDNVLAMRDSRGHVIAQRLVDGVDSTSPSDQTKLRFQSIDGQYFLTEVWQRFESSGLALVPSKHLTQLAKQEPVAPVETREPLGASQP